MNPIQREIKRALCWGMAVGFLVGALFTLAICLHWGNAFPEPW